MLFSTVRWTTAIATAALVALPIAAAAQTPQYPAAPAAPAARQAAKPPVDATAAKQQLTEARDTLSQLTSMPEAARLQGEARNQINQLISNFNGLINAQSDWRSAYAKVDENLNALLGPEGSEPPPATPPVPAATTGTTPGASASALDPTVRAKLSEFRMHLKEFEKAAGGPAASTSGAMPPSAATGTTANPANPVISGTGATSNPTGSNVTKPSPPSAMAGATGTSGTSATPTADANTMAAAQSELAAIDAILNKSRTGALTKAQTEALRRHVEALRALLK